MIRTIYLAIVVSIYFLISIIILLPIVILMGKTKGTKLARRLAKGWGKFIVINTGSKVKVIIKDEEDFGNIEEDEPIVVVGNHQSNIDIPLLLGYFPKTIAFVAKKEMETWPIIGLWMRRIKCVFLDRTNPREGIKSMKTAIQNIKEGYSIVVFPEGTRSKEGEISEFKKGSFKLAVDPGVKIIPVTIKGTIDVLGKNSKKIKKNKDIKLIIDKSINPGKMDREEKKELNETVREIIVNNYNEY